MKLAFYYHIVVLRKNNQLSLPSYLGVFIDSLAIQCEELFLVFHEADSNQADECDYTLRSKNIVEVNLGLKTPAWHRAIFYWSILKGPLQKIESCDAFIVRAPSPLAPYFSKYFTKHNALFFMIVGDYIEGAVHLRSSTFRDKMIFLFLRYNDRLFTKEIRKTNILVNSKALFDKYMSIAKSVALIKTTTLSMSDFLKREDTCSTSEIKLLYTGRIDPAKGLFELVESFANLVNQNYNLSLHIVGWEEDVHAKPVESQLIKKAIALNVDAKVFFHGRKSVGDDLNKMYRFADIYVLPSYHEGFPRTIWEAMANSLPVLTTNVGGIPSFLTNEENVILIQPKSAIDIENGIKRIIENPDLRKKIIGNGFNLAQENTLEIQSKKIIEIIKTSI